MKKINALIITASLTTIISGCEKPIPEMPEVNNENCTTENIEKLDKRIIKRFSSKCAARPIYRPIKRKKW